jgi:hypothetical protein
VSSYYSEEYEVKKSEETDLESKAVCARAISSTRHVAPTEQLFVSVTSNSAENLYQINRTWKVVRVMLAAVSLQLPAMHCGKILLHPTTL